ncbi:MAG: nucleotide pyrophosphohydrolase [Candidatus Marinimicrobia bacterium]|nr:nucleotide pyrophosphohydrolase [Candidatus Neomarinimicrobiota bacterium]MBT3962420.1 nucleotide pyrophosphohydrolase [Candidatus Neomarinimicrobiota bacterium]MBT4684667.1 nucleotide pyrophosphohydrolase [Candidatus Neomarinimicrobiota bacterium]MBT5461221.1 nucleotide pyrophosphohydrolase [Candidatus Neomarinimicrobiota bacterium]MBT7902066.1 nucleotide pyrophosphohydrolase [Candidatus Neomarinimicrobiota bacterium]
MTDFDKIIDLIIKFRDERDWKQFHNSKDLSLALSIEAAELNELFLWKNSEDVNEDRLKEELADILIYALLLSKQYDLNIEEIILSKLEINSNKYPVEKSRGKSSKYTEL